MKKINQKPEIVNPIRFIPTSSLREKLLFHPQRIANFLCDRWFQLAMALMAMAYLVLFAYLYSILKEIF
tara:strand:+ start:875 stop:1081 length:207 start_codon:yes stop_codon:yes gene_type:complete